MKKIWNSIKRDLWVVLLDVVAVNASYYLALLIRFYVNFEFRPRVLWDYLPAWTSFTPWYTLICLLIFFAFHLYGGIWRYAGINDMNRIIGANIVTTLVHVVGSVAFFSRMPITYYAIGAVLQFFFIAAIRFGYRVLLVEKKNISMRHEKRINTVVVGTGENGRRVVKNLEESEMYRPIAVVGPGDGTMDGLPILPMSVITGIEGMTDAPKETSDAPRVDAPWFEIHNVQAIFIADPLLPSGERQRIKEMAEKAQIELHEYTGFFSNLGGRLSLTELLATIHTPLILVMDGEEEEEERTFSCGEDALRALTEKYSVADISGDKLKLKLIKQKKTSNKEALEKAYAAVTEDD